MLLLFSFKKTLRFLTIIWLSFSLCLISSSIQAKPKYQFNNALLKIKFSPVAPEKIAAFYEGRGFSRPMINILKQHCFITIGIHNKSNDIIWLDISNWSFTNKTGPIKRINRAQWKFIWKEMNIPLAHQSTFRWTLLPEQLDFRSNEHEGGNITLPYSKHPFTLTAEFRTKADKSGKPIKVKLQGIQCAN